MIRTPKQALAVADDTHTNVPGTCQLKVRGYFNAPSAGDFDGDGSADAEDGWKSEPAWARHPGDRNPPLGYPVSFSGGSHDNGHRAISRGNGILRSTDFDGVTKRYRAGVVGNGTIAEVERAMGVTYLGWSTTIDGQPIPHDVEAKPLEENDMTPEQMLAAKVTAVDNHSVEYVLATTCLKVQAIEKALAALGKGISPAVEQAVKEALAEGVVSVDVTVKNSTSTDTNAGGFPTTNAGGVPSGG